MLSEKMIKRQKTELEKKEYCELSRYIDSLGFSVRSTNVILQNCSSQEKFNLLNEETLMTFPNCGRKTVREILGFLDTFHSNGVVEPTPSVQEQLASSPEESSLSLLPLFSSKKLDDITVEDLHPDFRPGFSETR